MANRLSTATCMPTCRLLFLACLMICGSGIARADVIPDEEDACSGKHRAGDVCTGWNKQGTCQPSKCLEVDPSTPRGTPRKDRKMIEVPCLKCVWTQAQQTPSRSSACSIGQPFAARQEIPLAGLVAIATIGLVTLRRRRLLSTRR
jgi:hypothetical protein